VAIFSVGATMSLLTGRHPVTSGARMLVVGAVTASVTFGVGRLLHVGTAG
jgi:VIT1/CCC1 family predicted Fe2+/Mn2+ transporter